jgi:hypothetical protein
MLGRMRKINHNGTYLPFYGYTCIAKIENKNTLCIEDFIKTSKLGLFYSALPNCSYHVTLYNIYNHSDIPIKPICDWNPNFIPKHDTWIPEHVLVSHHIKASEHCKQIQYLTIYPHKLYHQGSLGFTLNLDSTEREKIFSLRKSLEKIYYHDDSNLKLFHITFAYQFKQIDIDISPELQHLDQLIQDNLSSSHTQQPDIFLFRNMTSYIPFQYFYTG